MPTEIANEFCSASASPTFARICGAMTHERTRIMIAAPNIRKLASFARSVGTWVSEGAIEP